MAGAGKTRIFRSAFMALGLVALGAGTNCSGSTGESHVDPCTKISCGQACDPATSCGSGQYCGGDSKCTADCVPGDNNCGDKQRCNGAGKCVDDISIDVGGTSNPGGGVGTGGTNVCASTNVDLSNQLPTVLLLVDQSGSMNAEFGTSDRWQTLRTALMEPTMGIVKTLQSQVRFGLTLYSGKDGAAPCPLLTTVNPMLNNFDPIDMAYPVPTDAIIDDTPTGESIDAAAKILQAVTDPGPKVIVLATDGEPDTCATPDPQTEQAKEVAIKAAQNAFAGGVFTFYISVGNEVSDMHATEMANVGQGYPRNDPMQRFYRANDQKQLADAFATIVNGVRSCSFQLSGMVKEGSEGDGVVMVDGVAQPLNDPNGWRLSSPTTVELQGKACETVKDTSKDHKVNAEFPCDSIIPFKPPA